MRRALRLVRPMAAALASVAAVRLLAVSFALEANFGSRRFCAGPSQQANVRCAATTLDGAGGPPPRRVSGTVERWLNLKGIGWIRPDDGDETIFCHFSEIQGAEDFVAELDGEKKITRGAHLSLREGERVEFTLVANPKDDRELVAADVTGPGGADVIGYKRGEKVGWREATETINEVYVGNLAFRTTHQRLREHFESVGLVVKRSEIAVDGWDEKNNHPFSKGWGTVRLTRPGDCVRAIKDLDGTKLDGREIYVREYNPQTHGDSRDRRRTGREKRYDDEDYQEEMNVDERPATVRVRQRFADRDSVQPRGDADESDYEDKAYPVDGRRTPGVGERQLRGRIPDSYRGDAGDEVGVPSLPRPPRYYVGGAGS